MSEYMPKVGEVCEVIHNCDELDYIRCEPLAIKNGRIAYYVPEKNSVGFLDPECFRPLKTKQDIEREEIIANIRSLTPVTNDWVEALAEALYDAGYRNGVKVDKDDLADFTYVPDEINEVIGIKDLFENFDIFRKLES